MSDCLIPSDAASATIPIYGVRPAEAETTAARLCAGGEVYAAGCLRAQRFEGAAGSLAVLPGDNGAPSAVLFGLGAGPADPLAAGALATGLPPGDYALAEGFDDPAAAVIAFALGAYRFTRYKAGKPRDVRLAVPAGVDGDDVLRIVAGVYLARDLINTPPNDMGPEELASAALDLAARHDAAIEIVVGDDLLAQGFPLVHAVGAGSPRAPRLIDMRWGAPSHPRVTLVGKGVCFDTGGLDIKPSSGMLLMKKDMGGAANVLGLAHMIMDAKLPVNLRVIVPAVENAVSGTSFRPSDVYPSRKGLTVEIGNTDAEGRLVLADALALACEEKPDLLIDLATLTGAARVAVGPDLPPFYTDDEALAADLGRLSMEVGDPVWRLPLWRPYARWLDSKVADINNNSAAPFAGSVTAALFLARFVEGAGAWVHFDIYGWAPQSRPGRVEGGEAQSIRALYALLKERLAAGTLTGALGGSRQGAR
ncbi:leucyl aminopeptidase [Pseudoxanthobacter soli DSM 19599]|uniref:Leucyl aminopeptidase n=1 Tax=Pseudoxanthobacter soli DSM 19599 TaxID=1123029 RepID=A0A1M7ZBZ7_9HYPH|nr:leucyl aminopeptidase family protein [Pseudoxanthobacter soli]SHO62425.1 leucyl aminopeptidase [Pseudoxanthobacter soli DSM 19599]